MMACKTWGPPRLVALCLLAFSDHGALALNRILSDTKQWILQENNLPSHRESDVSARAMRKASLHVLGMQATHVVTWNIVGEEKAEAAQEKFACADGGNSLEL